MTDREQLEARIRDDLQSEHRPLTPEDAKRIEKKIRTYFKIMPEENSCKFRQEDYKLPEDE